MSAKRSTTNDKTGNNHDDWTCNRCTFVNRRVDFENENNVDFNRCRMCHSFRARDEVQRMKSLLNKNSTSSSVAYASTASARKRRRQRKEKSIEMVDSENKRGTSQTREEQKRRNENFEFPKRKRYEDEDRNKCISLIDDEDSIDNDCRNKHQHRPITTGNTNEDNFDSKLSSNDSRRKNEYESSNSQSQRFINHSTNRSKSIQIQNNTEPRKDIIQIIDDDNSPDDNKQSSRKPKQKSNALSSSSKVQQTLFGKPINSHVAQVEPKLKKRKLIQSKSASLATRGQQHKVEEIDPTSNPSVYNNTQSKSITSSVSKKVGQIVSTTNSITSNVKKKLSYEQLHKKAMHILKNTFKIKSLRHLQPQAIQTALKEKSQIIILATGGGKSLCYQLPAMTFEGVTIVISPLLALMIDQVNSLRAKGIEAVHVSSSNTEKENDMIMKRLLGIVTTSKGDNGKKGSDTSKNNLHQQQIIQKEKQIKIVYCTPESITKGRTRSILPSLYKRKMLSLIAIDEAHCLSTWGHDFRHSYRDLSYLRDAYPEVPLMACTATATKGVIEDIRQVLQLNNGEACHMSTFNRPNIEYDIRYKDAMGETAALQDLVTYIKEEHSKASRNNIPCSGIVYVHKRTDTELIVSQISKAGIPAAPYHAGMKEKDRKQTQKLWTDGNIKVVVATVAFGMGIDLAHVRYVIHWTLSKSVEGFYQESGRAGRDGLQSKSILYYSRDDASKLQFIITKGAEAAKAKGNPNATKTAERSMNALNNMIDLCTQRKCRRKFLLGHFGEEIEPQVVCKKTCDFCIDPGRMDREMDKRMVSIARKDVWQQQQRFSSAKKWQGESGEYSDEHYSDDDFYNESDLGITKYTSFGIESTPKHSSGFKSARDVLSHYEKMESSRQKSGQNKGFVTFKMSKSSGSEDHYVENEKTPKMNTVKVPNHIRQQMSQLNKVSVTPKKAATPGKGSKDYRSEADKLRAELAELQRQKEMLDSST